MGVIWLWFWLKSTPMSVLIAGILPLLPGDIIKAVISAYVASRKQVMQIIHHNAL
jgi:biotin transporter BioY